MFLDVARSYLTVALGCLMLVDVAQKLLKVALLLLDVAQLLLSLA